MIWSSRSVTCVAQRSPLGSLLDPSHGHAVVVHDDRYQIDPLGWRTKPKRRAPHHVSLVISEVLGRIDVPPSCGLHLYRYHNSPKVDQQVYLAPAVTKVATQNRSTARFQERGSKIFAKPGDRGTV